MMERGAEQTPPAASLSLSLSPSQIGSAVDGCAGCWRRARSQRLGTAYTDARNHATAPADHHHQLRA